LIRGLDSILSEADEALKTARKLFEEILT